MKERDELSEIDTGLGKEVKRISRENVYLCYQCKICSSGCPTSYLMDFPPHRLVRAMQLGESALVLNSNSLWYCAQCHTCTARCPFDIDIAKVIRTLRLRLAKEKKFTNKKTLYHSLLENLFLNQVTKLGRIFELGLMIQFKLKTFQLFSDLILGAKMFGKGKMPFFPTKAKDLNKIKKMYKKAIEIEGI